MKTIPLLTLLSSTLLLSSSLYADDVMRLDTLTRTTQKIVPFVIPDFPGENGTDIAAIVRNNLLRYGTFAHANVSPADVQVLDTADKDKNTIHARNWANLGVQILGKGVAKNNGSRLSIEFVLYSPHDGKQLFARRYSGSGKGIRMIGHKIADDVIEAVLNEKGFFASRLLFVQGDYKKKNIAICDSDGKNTSLLTSGNTLCIQPDWFPNGDKILFTSYYEGRPIMYEMILRNGSTRRLLALPGMNTCGSVSPDGNHLAAVIDKDGHPELYVMTVGGGKMHRLTRSRAVESSPSWSPDSRQLVYSSDSAEGKPQIYTISRSGGTPKRITTSTFSRYCTSPVWSPDGKKIAFVAKKGGNYEICVHNLETRDTYQVTNNPSNDESPSWARNSRHIAFARTYGQNSRIFLIDSETGKETPLVSTGQYSGAPTWQP